MNDKDRINSLTAATDNYRNTIRWGQNIEKLNKIKVTTYKSIHKELSDDGNEAKQTVEIKYYNIDHMIEKTIIDKQLWKYDPDKKTWRLKSRLPEFK